MTPDECPDATNNLTEPIPAPQPLVSPSLNIFTTSEELTPLECLELLLKDSSHPCALEYTETPGSPLECLRLLLIDLNDPCREGLEPVPEEPLPPCYSTEPVAISATYEPICQAPDDKPGENYQPKLPNDDLDCGNQGVPSNVKVVGEDAYNLDRDKDGIGCEDDEWGGNGGSGGGGIGSGGRQGSGSGPNHMVPRPGQAVVKIYYEDAWSGNLSDGGFDSASYDGSGDSSIAFDCASGDIYSLTIQKGEDDNEVMKLIIEDYAKKVIDQGQTSAEFGIVSLSDTC
jgi:hypothetical protein